MTDKKPSKFRQEHETEKPSGRLRHEEGGAGPGEITALSSGQVGPKQKADRQKAKAARRLSEAKARTEKAAEGLADAREKLAASEQAPPPGPAEGLAAMAGREAAYTIHGKIHEAERDNTGLEAAHRAERTVESAGHAVGRFARRQRRTRPARRVRVYEHKAVKAGADFRFREAVLENPELKSNPVSRYIQKQRLRKFHREQASETQWRPEKTALSALWRAGRVAAFVKRHPGGILAGLFGFLLLVVLQSCIGTAFTAGGGIGGAAAGTSYLASDADIDDAELSYTAWETDLAMAVKDAATSHPGYDEYRYDIAETGHDPYALLAYLTARYDAFTFAAVEGELQSIFNEQYALTFTPIVEVRSYTVTVSGTDANGNSFSSTRTVYYNYYILQTTLTARPFEEVISPRLTTQDEKDRYRVYMFLHGNRQYISSPLDFNWLPYVSSVYGYRVHPISGEKSYHAGADIALAVGTEIKAGGDGEVTFAGVSGGYGLTLLVDYGNGVTARYAHCDRLLFDTGQTVEKGEIIALSGNTGNSTGPHLHIEVMKDGRLLNPLYFVEGTVG